MRIPVGAKKWIWVNAPFACIMNIMRKEPFFSVTLACLPLLLILMALGLALASCENPADDAPPVLFTVTFDANNGSGAVPGPISARSGSSITMPDGNGLSRRHSVFSGWNTDDSGTGTNYSVGSSYLPAGDITLFANWNAAPLRTYSESVKEVQFSAATATVVLENLHGHDIYLVKVNASNSMVSGANVGIVHALSELPFLDHPAADEFNANPPPIVDEPSRRQRTAFVPPIVGDTSFFWVETYYGSGKFEQRQAVLLATGTHGNIWVMGEDSITSELAQTMADKFDLIYPPETNLLGYEYGGGPDGDGGKDGDPKVQILVYDMLNADGEQSGAGCFFWSKDFYNASLGSNLAEIFYINTNTVTNTPDYAYSALIHELQHMINFNEKYVKQSVHSASWYNEMLSMMTEDVIAPLIGVAPTNSMHVIRTRMPIALANYYSEGITEWKTLDKTSYAKGFAFGAYLLRNYGGAELLHNMLANSTADIASITSALNQFQSGLTFDQALKRYGEAMIFSGSQMPENVLSYDKTITKTINGTAYTAYGFDIWNDFIQQGPAVLDLSQREIRPYSIVIHSTDEWINRAGLFSLTMDKPSDPSVALYLMVR